MWKSERGGRKLQLDAFSQDSKGKLMVWGAWPDCGNLGLEARSSRSMFLVKDLKGKWWVWGGWPDCDAFGEGLQRKSVASGRLTRFWKSEPGGRALQIDAFGEDSKGKC